MTAALKILRQKSGRSLAFIVSMVALWALSGCAPAPTPTSALPALATPTDPGPTLTTQDARPTLTPAAPVCAETRGRVERGQIETDLLYKPLEFSLYLPPCYSETPAQPYPVLYLLHGQTYTDEQWIRLGAADAADRLITSGEAPPFLIVFPYETYSAKDPIETQYGRALVEVLLPWVDAHYPTCTQRACRAIGGLSRGAAWAVRLGFEHWDAFNSIGAHSLAIFYYDSNRLYLWLKPMQPEEYPRVYLDAGHVDPERRSVEAFEQKLSDTGVPHEWHVFKGAHDEVYWQAHVEEYLRWYASGWAAPQAAPTDP